MCIITTSTPSKKVRPFSTLATSRLSAYIAPHLVTANAGDASPGRFRSNIRQLLQKLSPQAGWAALLASVTPTPFRHAPSPWPLLRLAVEQRRVRRQPQDRRASGELGTLQSNEASIKGLVCQAEPAEALKQDLVTESPPGAGGCGA